MNYNNNYNCTSGLPSQIIRLDQTYHAILALFSFHFLLIIARQHSNDDERY